LSAAAAELQDFFSKNTDRFRVWTSGGFK
jgi:hypothetical protein